MASHSSQRSALPFLAVVGVIAVAFVAYITHDPEPPAPTIPDEQLAAMRPAEELPTGHAPSSECRECHEHNHDTWHASYHRTMTQLVTPETVMGDFDDRQLKFAGLSQTFHLHRRDGMPWVTFSDPVSFFPISQYRRKSYPLVLSTGSHHMQLYWLPVGADRTLALMPLSYLRDEQRWIPRHAAFLAPPAENSDPELARWNETCIHCHTTFGEPRIQPGRTFSSSSAEFGISCEACHGASAEHIAHHRQAAAGADLADVPDPIVNPAHLDHRESSAVCGTCHSVQDGRNEKPFVPGDVATLQPHLIRRDEVVKQIAEAMRELPPEALKDTAMHEHDDLLDDTFWPDGMVRVAGREYSSLIESACHQQGTISCMSCHDLHQMRQDKRPANEWANDMLDHRKTDDRACIQCHNEPAYASPAHTHHTAASDGSRCYNCHMPHTSYGLLKSVRSHTIDSPNVASTIQTGRPNACNLCHLDRSLAWTAGHLSDWFGHNPPELNEEQSTLAHAAVTALKGDAPQRALIAWHMSWPPAVKASGSDWLAPYLGMLLKDRYGAVRFIAERSLRQHPEFKTLDYDFLNPRRDLILASESVVQTWSRSTNRTTTARPELLIDKDGRLDQARFESLHAQRDDRDIMLAE